jgi:hypothetical protein
MFQANSSGYLRLKKTCLARPEGRRHLWIRASAAVLFGSIQTGAIAEWSLLDQNPWFQTYVDRIVRVGEIAGIWVLTNYDLERFPQGIQGIKSVKVYLEFNCKTKKMRTVTFNRYSAPMAGNGTGLPITSETQPTMWSPVEPDMSEAGLLAHVCANSKLRS